MKEVNPDEHWEEPYTPEQIAEREAIRRQLEDLEDRYQEIKNGENPPEAVEPPEDNDPFSPRNVHTVNAILLMRIYDVLMALLNDQNEDMANYLTAEHEAGRIILSFPKLTM